MGIFADLQAKISVGREAGRDIPPVIEELLLLIADVIEPQQMQEPQPPVSNDHVAEGATQFTPAEIAASAEQPNAAGSQISPASAAEPANQEPAQPTPQQ